MAPDDGLEVAQRGADAGPDIEDAALELSGHGREVDAVRRILVVDEVVLFAAGRLRAGTSTIRLVTPMAPCRAVLPGP